jgi:hypothetical protein
MDRDYILCKLKENEDFFKSHGVLRIGLFGSYAKGEQNEESDIDILVELKNENITRNFYEILFFLENLFEQKIDLIHFSKEKPVYNLKTSKEHFEKVREDILESVIYA